MIQKTLVLLKPDCVQRQLCGEVLLRFEKVGFKIKGMKMVWESEEHYGKHYYDVAERHGQEIFKKNLKTMVIGPVVAMVLEGEDAIETIRKMVGPTEPKQALPGTIRGDYSHQTYGAADKAGMGIKNLIHASANPKDAEYEINLWFKGNELYDYKTVHEVHLF
ncbi:MAG: nucleoside-diphosphate kinase [Candidatus Woesearchaeota archaeon]